MYYAENLIYECTIEGVANAICKLAKYPKDDINTLIERYRLIIDDIKVHCSTGCYLCDENFGYIAVPHEEHKDFPYVALADIDKVVANNYSLKGISEFCWLWEQAFGINVHKGSIEKYGVDAILGGILYHITYYDMSEEEIKPIRENLEKKTNFSTTNQIDFYRNLIDEICVYRDSLKNNIMEEQKDG